MGLPPVEFDDSLETGVCEQIAISERRDGKGSVGNGELSECGQVAMVIMIMA